MQIPRMSMITLGVANLERATEFYRQVLALAPNTSNPGVTFVELPGVWLGLYPLADLARDIDPARPVLPPAPGSITLAHNTRHRDDVAAVIERARAAGATVLKEAADTFWGGYSGYFADLDGHVWEIAWGPMFDF
ncbi:MAG TPA: VOC family protein, partial [Rhodocyclaceae bacterium]